MLAVFTAAFDRIVNDPGTMLCHTIHLPRRAVMQYITRVDVNEISLVHTGD